MKGPNLGSGFHRLASRVRYGRGVFPTDTLHFRVRFSTEGGDDGKR